MSIFEKHAWKGSDLEPGYGSGSWTKVISPLGYGASYRRTKPFHSSTQPAKATVEAPNFPLLSLINLSIAKA